MDTKYKQITNMGIAQLAAFLVDLTYYQESAWSLPSYRNFGKGGTLDNRKEAISEAIKWLKKEDK